MIDDKMLKLIDVKPLFKLIAELEAEAFEEVKKYDPSEDLLRWNKWMAILNERTAFKQDLLDAPTLEAEPIVRCKDCKHRFLEIIEGKKVFSCLYRMGTLDLNGYCDCGAKMDERR